MAFVTGSYAYGNPIKEDDSLVYRSDVDLVILVSQADLERILEAWRVENPLAKDPYDPKYPPPCGLSLRFGILNLLVCTEKKQFDVWLEGTRELKRKRPVTRARAIELFGRLRKKAGLIRDKDPKGGPG